MWGPRIILYLQPFFLLPSSPMGCVHGRPSAPSRRPPPAARDPPPVAPKKPPAVAEKAAEEEEEKKTPKPARRERRARSSRSAAAEAACLGLREQVAAGWPVRLSAVVGEAIDGWTPRRADSFEKIDKVRTPALLEILILRRLHHPNVIKLEGLVTSRMSCSLYLVFEYMEHDLVGLAASPDINFTEPQVKCFPDMSSPRPQRPATRAAPPARTGRRHLAPAAPSCLPRCRGLLAPPRPRVPDMSSPPPMWPAATAAPHPGARHPRPHRPPPPPPSRSLIIIELPHASTHRVCRYIGLVFFFISSSLHTPSL
ncbi:probable serine/threonine-protein kinase At1g54610 isoform X2 [Oryza sativa Japonica Group]|uniref:probable serine/threonine-protein kinase At1g54610 isoform X2 n=1 Tax=Oryza sativa subsp. japonica TaxID=39947 RepID=UPI00339D0DEF